MCHSATCLCFTPGNFVLTRVAPWALARLPTTTVMTPAAAAAASIMTPSGGPLAGPAAAAAAAAAAAGVDEHGPEEEPGAHEELVCVIGVIRHGDRHPKQKLKLTTRHPRFLQLFRAHVWSPKCARAARVCVCARCCSAHALLVGPQESDQAENRGPFAGSA